MRTPRLFDYSSIRADMRERLRELAAVFEAPPQTAADVVIVGKSLMEAKRLLGRTKWGEWLETESGWNVRMVRHYLKVARYFGNLENGKIFRFQLSALYVLSRAAVSDDTRRAAIQEAARGERITHTRALVLAGRQRKQRGTHEEQAIEFAKSPSFLAMIFERFDQFSIHHVDDRYHATAVERSTGKWRQASGETPELAQLALADCEPQKKCLGECGQLKKISFFSRDARQKDGRCRACKECESKRVSQYS